MDLAVVTADILGGAACFLVVKGAHPDHWLQTHILPNSMRIFAM